MQIVGLNFTKTLAEKTAPLVSNPTIDIKFEFPDIKEESLDVFKDSKVLKINFIHAFSFSDEKKELSEESSKSEKSKSDSKKEKKQESKAKIEFQGEVLLTVTKDESIDIMKSWKKKQVSQNTQHFLMNFLTKKCAPKAISFADELNLPHPFLRIPQFSIAPQDSKDSSDPSSRSNPIAS